jgi:HEPN domain-containing protein
MRKADDDLGAAARLLEAEPGYFAIIAFHCQQGAEKALKAFLTWHQVEFPKTHDLRLLLDLIAKVDETLANALADAQVLTQYGVEYRYPGDYPEVGHEDVAEALRIAVTVRDEVRSRLPASMHFED